MVNSEVLLSALSTRVLSVRITYLEETYSTNLLAKKMIQDGCGEGTVVIADRQVKGRGRHGRKWHSPTGGLYFSIVLKPPLGDLSSPLLGIILANAAVGALQELAMIRTRLKWPNDLMVNEKKLGGILGELVRSSSGHALAVLGIGINISLDTSNLPDMLQTYTTTIAKESHIVPTREELVCHIINSIDLQLQQIHETQAFDFILKEYRQNCVTLGKKVQIELPTGTIIGTATDIDENGSLIVTNKDGPHLISAGEVIHLK